MSSEVIINGLGEYKFANKSLIIKPFDRKDSYLFPISTAKTAYVDFTGVNFPLILRKRKDGDIITPFGMEGSMKLKKYFNSRGIQRHNRDAIPLLCKDDEVLWAIGVGISSKVAVKEIPTHILEIV